MVPVASEVKITSAARNSVAVDTTTAIPDTTTARPEVAAASSTSASELNRPPDRARSSRSRLR